MTTVIIFLLHAEDGIRFYRVTGVQTCALPIWIYSVAVVPYGRKPVHARLGLGAGGRVGRIDFLAKHQVRIVARLPRGARSEERRGGENDRCRVERGQ